jgi:hypothetical protein
MSYLEQVLKSKRGVLAERDRQVDQLE